MTPDVRATVDWLLAEGFEMTETLVGGMASAVVKLHRTDLDITVSRDRGQWMVDFHVGGKNLDLDAVHSARIGRTEWPESPRGLALVQIPDDVEWRSEVESSLRWILSTPDTISQVAETRRQRAIALWG